MELIKKIGYRYNGNWGTSWGLFLCSYCNNVIERSLSNGRRYKSCGCYQDYHKDVIKHGESNAPLYRIWSWMKTRCYNHNSFNYRNYGGRGIKVFNGWLDKEGGYINFRDWALANGYRYGLEIDRSDNNGNYEPNNCGWVTSEENCQNQRTTKLNKEKVLEIRKKYSVGKYTQKELSNEYNVSISTICSVINSRNWKNVE